VVARKAITQLRTFEGTRAAASFPFDLGKPLVEVRRELKLSSCDEVGERVEWIQDQLIKDVFQDQPIFVKSYPQVKCVREWGRGRPRTHHLEGGTLEKQEGKLVGASGFEPPTSWSRTRRSSQAEPRPEVNTRT
jgi:hypothetical protein